MRMTIDWLYSLFHICSYKEQDECRLISLFQYFAQNSMERHCPAFKMLYLFYFECLSFCFQFIFVDFR